jgi:uncharacterized membrane protein YcaP (DUF421 family)
MTDNLFYDGWFGPLRILITGSLAYVGLIVLLRATGKRTLSKMNAFDLVVTVALGSTLATVLLDSSVPLVEGLTALSLLVALQYVITWGSVRSPVVLDLVKGEPTLLVRDGAYLPDAMRRTRVTRDEVDAALRQQGVDNISNVRLVVLETDGSLSVVRVDQ